MERLVELDRQLFLFLNNLGTEQWDWMWVAISNKWTAIPLYAFLLYLIFRKFGWKALLLTMVVVTLLITATDQLANVFKDGFQRLRPCGQEGVKEYARMVADYCGKYGYFSAHASNSAGVALFLGLLFRKHYPKLIWFLLGWALIVAYSRIYLGVHYPGDILTGILIGSILGTIFYKLEIFLLKKFNLT